MRRLTLFRLAHPQGRPADAALIEQYMLPIGT
jgi:hypothetical protein